MIELTDENFNEKVEQSHGIMLVDMWAEWCGPCKKMLDVLNGIDESAIATFGKMNVEENPYTPTRLGLRGVPTLILYKDGVKVGQKAGAQTREQILEWVASAAG